MYMKVLTSVGGSKANSRLSRAGWALSYLSAAAMGQLFIQNTEGNRRSRERAHTIIVGFGYLQQHWIAEAPAVNVGVQRRIIT